MRIICSKINIWIRLGFYKGIVLYLRIINILLQFYQYFNFYFRFSKFVTYMSFN